nr:Cry9Bb-like protein [Bacillus thuringiensis]
MNRNNQGEYEIIDASTCGCSSDDVVQYPLARDPNAAFQNMNYKDYLKMSDGDYVDSYINPGLSIGRRDVTLTGVGIVALIVGTLGGPVGGIVTGLISSLLGLLWPSNDNDVWEAFMAQIEELIEQRIADQVVRNALDNLTGLRDYYNQYLLALEEWQERPNAVRSTLVFNRFETLHSHFVTSMPSFGSGPGSERYAVQLLTVYAQAANLHLLLLRDADIYGARWGLRESQIDLYFNELQNRTRDYTNHCVTAYNNGLEEIRGTSPASWLRYHQFRRETTLIALDLVAIFPYYNVREYPIGVNPQLTRDVYTDPIGVTFRREDWETGVECRPWVNTPYMSFSDLENAIIRPPHLFETLRNLTIHTGRYNLVGGARFIEGWVGHSVTNTRLGNSTVFTSNYGSLPPRFQVFNFTNFDVYQINTRADSTGTFRIPGFAVTRAQFIPGGTYSVAHRDPGACQQDYDSIEELPSLDPDEPINRSYSHRLSHVTLYKYTLSDTDYGVINYTDYGSMPAYVWTHRDVDLTNTITADRITQLPLVKASTLPAGTTVVKGPGFTGGDILRRTTNGTFGTLHVRVNSPLTQQYRLRVRFASTGNFSIRVLRGGTSIGDARFGSTMNRGQELTYESFVTREFTTTGPFNPPFTFTQTQEILTVNAEGVSTGGEYYIDSIEIVPVNPTREAEEDLEAAKKAVASLFTRTRDGLQVNVTDYQVDRAANLVLCLSDEQYAHDKKMLLEAVRAAKRLSRERNLLQDPDFNEINSTEDSGWKTSNGIIISEGGPFFKGRALQLASARENYPTYIYQKVDSSMLKPYTRYKLDGFVQSSQDLEIELIHHHKVHLVKNVPDNLVLDTYPDGSCNGINRCEEQQMVNSQLETEHHPMDCCEASQTHEFSSYIHTGDLNASVDQGIWVVLKIRTTDGSATLGNLELVEVGPLSGESLEREQRDNAKWNAELGRKRAEADRVYQGAKQAINHLFVDYQDQQLNPEVGLAEISEARNLIESISDVYCDAVLRIPGINYEMYTELSNRLQQAAYLYTSRNAVQNGDFNSGLDSWNATTDATVQQDGNMYFLVLSHWDAQVSQQFRVQPNCKYVLRVTAKKVGNGDGYVTIQDGAHHRETLTFNACDYDVNGTHVNDNSYITKELEFYPKTEHMWVEVSETEGTFYIDSIELIETQE